MKETTYKCDVCGHKRKEEELTPFSPTDDSIKLIDITGIRICPTERHICNKCISIIYHYQKEGMGRAERGKT